MHITCLTLHNALLLFIMNQPLISGFTFIKNGLTLGYPIKESIESIDQLCDEIVINVGFDDPNLVEDDGTYEYLTSHFTGPKYKFLKSWWDPELRKDGLILSQQTNIALKECTGKYCQYIQGDEAIHEQDLEHIKAGIQAMENDPELDGLIFKYIHLYGNVDTYLYTRRIYRREVRLIRNHKNIVSHLDAQGFRHADGKKLLCKQIDATIYHYGWARQEQVMQKKVAAMDKLYHSEDRKSDFQYVRMWGIKPFKGTHPLVMKNWIDEHRNDVDIMSLPLTFRMKNISLVISDFIESLTGYRIGEYKNFILK